MRSMKKPHVWTMTASRFVKRIIYQSSFSIWIKDGNLHDWLKGRKNWNMITHKFNIMEEIENYIWKKQLELNAKSGKHMLRIIEIRAGQRLMRYMLEWGYGAILWRAPLHSVKFHLLILLMQELLAIKRLERTNDVRIEKAIITRILV